MTDDELLVPRFVGIYEKLDELTAWETDPISQQLAVGAPDGYGFDKWRPFQVNAASSLLEPLYAKLPRDSQSFLNSSYCLIDGLKWT